MIYDNSLDNRVIGFSFSKAKSELVIFKTLWNPCSIIVHTVCLYFDLNVLLMSGILTTGFFNNIKIFEDDFTADFDVENSLASVLEIHFSEFQYKGVNSSSNRQFVGHLLICVSFVHVYLLVEGES